MGKNRGICPSSLRSSAFAPEPFQYTHGANEPNLVSFEMPILWGQNDPFFTVDGAKAFQRDLPKAELHVLAGGHYALEEYGQLIADEMTRFLSNQERNAAR
jgi:pimeloyl-ACP methyl ester carboxylesterase